MKENDLQRIKALIEEHNNITIEEIREKLGLKASYTTVERAVIDFGFTLKKKSLHASVTAPDVQTKRASWKEQIGGIDPSHLVYLDECGVNIDLTRLYGRSIDKARVVDHAPLNTPRMTTVLSSIRTDGSHITATYTGGTTGERFTDYLKNNLIPELKPGDVVMMDNMRSHHVQGMRERGF